MGSQGEECDPLDYPCSNGSIGDDGNLYCLYDIVNDLGEKEDLVNKELLQKMLDKYNTYNEDITW